MLTTEFDWGEFLPLAKRLSGGSESEQRTAICRAYYAAYHACKRYMRDEYDYVPPEGDSHGPLWRKAQCCGDRELKSIGGSGHTLRKTRNDADYRTRFGRDLRYAVIDAIDRAESIIRRLEARQDSL